jgi:hypothetical protein
MDTPTAGIRKRILGTTIDPASLLSTDYFDHFNEPIMLLGMLPDMPDMLDEVDQWRFRTYCEHFTDSGLSFAGLAIEAYALAPRHLRQRFDTIATQMHMLIVETRSKLRYLLEDGRIDQFRDTAALHALQLQGMVDDGSAIVHGSGASADQAAVDALF